MAMGFWFESFNREMPTKAGKRRERSQVKWLAKLGAHAKTINSGRPTPREPQFGELVEGPVGSKVTRGISPFRPGSRVEGNKVRGCFGRAPSRGRTQKLSTQVGRRLESRGLASLSKGPRGAKLHGGFRRFGRRHELRAVMCAGVWGGRRPWGARKNYQLG
jgi:hypothetical protein